MFPEPGLLPLAANLVRPLTAAGTAKDAVKTVSQTDACPLLPQHCNAPFSFPDQYYPLCECLNCQVGKT